LNGRPEYVIAKIEPRHLDKGEKTTSNKTMAELVRGYGYGSKGGDDCGHIIANMLGGKMRLYNLFPQEKCTNRVEFKNTVEMHVYKFLDNFKSEKPYVLFAVNLTYSDSSKPMRPNQLKFKATFYRNGISANYSDIPIYGKHKVPANPYESTILNPINKSCTAPDEE
jgi:hypothetical protein